MRLLILLGLILGVLNAESRYALLIGNGDYSKNKLSNPTHDVGLLEKKLTKLGFTVIKKKNLKNSEMLSELRNFYTKINSDTIALIYFSGHGVNSTLDHQNYLMPIGSFKNLLNEADLPNEAISDSKLLASTSGAKFSILLLDACRSHDFAQTRGTKGLGQPQGHLKNDYVISYATEIGKTANDGNKNSPYAEALVKYLSSGYSIGDIFTKIRAEVSKKTNGNQKPYYNPHFENIFYLSSQQEELKKKKTKVTQERSIVKNMGFLPKNPAFPHGKGITRKEGKCNKEDNGCARGLPFASFNNYIDSGSGKGVNDERSFLVVQNQTEKSTSTKSILVNIGDQVYFRSYFHNNATDSIAHNVKIGMNGFTHVGNGIYESKADKRINVRQFLSSSNTIPSKISDDVLLVSESNRKVKLRFKSKTHTVRTLGVNTNFPREDNINIKDFFGNSGFNIGDVISEVKHAFFVQVTFWVVDGEKISYDLEINKTVNNKKSKDTASVGDTLKYRLYIKNRNASTGTPSNVSIYDNYDESKITIIQSSLAKACNDDGSVITCHIPNSVDTAPGKSVHTTYSAIIKQGATGTILNTAEVRPNPDYDTYQGNDRDSVVITIKNKFP